MYSEECLRETFGRGHKAGREAGIQESILALESDAEAREPGPRSIIMAEAAGLRKRLVRVAAQSQEA